MASPLCRRSSEPDRAPTRSELREMADREEIVLRYIFSALAASFSSLRAAFSSIFLASFSLRRCSFSSFLSGIINRMHYNLGHSK